MENKPKVNLRYQDRDGAILQMIYNYDGVVARRHIKYLFWHDKGWRAMERRLSLLKANEYLNWPSVVQRKIHPIPEPVVWIDWKGALLLAGQFGLQIEKPKSTNEYKLRRFERTLRAHGFYWLREPR